MPLVRLLFVFSLAPSLPRSALRSTLRSTLSLLSVASLCLFARVSSRPRLFSPVPSRLKCTEVTGSECAGSFFNSFPVFTSQIRTVSSKLPLTIRFDCGLKLTQKTKLRCPTNVLRQRPWTRGGGGGGGRGACGAGEGAEGARRETEAGRREGA